MNSCKYMEYEKLIIAMMRDAFGDQIHEIAKNIREIEGPLFRAMETLRIKREVHEDRLLHEMILRSALEVLDNEQ